MKKFILSAIFAIMFFTSSGSPHILDEIKEYDGHFYRVYNFGMNWNESKKFCENLGGHLVTITSKDEQDFIEKILSDNGNKKFYWIGGYKDNNNHNWRWITDEKFYFSNWHANEPNNIGGDENYLMISEDNSTWNDVNYSADYYGNDNFGFICEWESLWDIKLHER